MGTELELETTELLLGGVLELLLCCELELLDTELELGTTELLLGEVLELLLGGMLDELGGWAEELEP